MKRFLAQHNLQALTIQAYQDGDYHDDWVVVETLVIRANEDISKFSTK